MPVALPIALAIAQAIADPAIDAGQSLDERVREAWFGAGEQGWFLDPSNFASMYQDATGTTPVTGVEQPVGLMLDTCFGLERGDDLIVNGDFADGHDSWTTPNGDSFVADGELHVVVTTNTVSARSYQTLSGLVVGQFYEVTGNCRNVAGDGTPRIRVGTDASVTGAVSVNGDFRYVFFATATSMNLLLLSPNTTLGSEAAFSNIAVRHIPGNHFYQTTTPNRPVLSARVNLYNKSENLTDSAWTKNQVTVERVTLPDLGGITVDKVIPSTGLTNFKEVRQVTRSFLTGIPIAYQLRAKAAGYRYVQILGTSLTPGLFYVNFDLIEGVETYSADYGSDSVILSKSITPVGDGWFDIRVVVISTSTNNVSGRIGFNIMHNPDSPRGASAVHDGVSGIYVAHQQLEFAYTHSRYQRTETATDYDTEGFPVYLSFDGTDDCLMSNTIDFTGTDKMTVLAGVTKLSDAAQGIVVELSASSGGNDGVFRITAPESSGATFNFRNRGTVTAGADSASAYPAPYSAVLSAQGSISPALTSLRVNGVDTLSKANVGTGNYGNYPAFIGARNNASNRFNGRVYFLAARGAWTEGEALEMAETLAAKKMGIAA